MRNPSRYVAAAALALFLGGALATTAFGAPKKAPDASPSASASGSPAPLPTASPEPPAVAVPRLEAKLKANPGDRETMQQLASYYVGQGKPDQALALTRQLMSLGTKTAQVYYLDGVANESLGRIPEATSDFEQATTQEPTNAQILLTLTDLYLRTNRPADAERVAKRATTFNASDKSVFINYGLVLGQEGKFDDARAQFEQAAKLDPKDPLPVVFQARSYVSQKALALAAQDFDRALAIDPKSTDALFGKASLQAANHDVPNAVATYEQLLAVEPNDEAKAAVLVQEYQLYRDEKMTDQALAVLKRAEQTYPNVAAVHVAYGDYDASFGKDQAAAETEWRTALGPARDNPDALGRLGNLAASQGKKNDSLGYFKRLTEVVPNDPSAWTTLAQVYAQNGRYSDARGSFRHAFELQRSPQTLAGVGLADFQLHNYKECTQVFSAIDRNASEFMKQNPQLIFLYGKCSQSNGDTANARTAYTRVKTYFKPGSQQMAEINKALASLGTPAKAGAKTTAKTTKPASAKPSSSPKPAH